MATEKHALLGTLDQYEEVILQPDGVTPIDDAYVTANTPTYRKGTDGNYYRLIEFARAADMAYELSQLLTPTREDVVYLPTYELTKGVECPNVTGIKDKSLTVTGTSGSTTLTVSAGTAADFTGAFPCVVFDGTSYYSYYCKSVSGGVVTLSEPLKSTVTNGTLKTMHGGFNGQHLTDYGYRALADYLIDFPRGYGKRNSAHLFQPELNPAVIPFAATGGATTGGFVPGTTDFTNSLQLKSYSLSPSQLGGTIYLIQQGGTSGKGVQWSVSLGGKTGYLETAIGLRAVAYNSGANTTAGSAVVTLEVDGVQVYTKTITSYNVQRIVVPFVKATSAVLKIVTGDSTPTAIAVNRTGFYVTPVDSASFFNSDDKVVFLGDSWTQYSYIDGTSWAQDLTERFKAKFAARGGNPANVINSGRSGMTSAWGRHWFQKLVLDNNPTIAVLEFFTNDSNSAQYAGDAADLRWNFASAGSHTAGTDVEGKVTAAQWLENMQWMAEQCLANGIRPVVVMPAHTASLSQTQRCFDDFLSLMGVFKYYDIKDTLSKNVYSEEGVYAKQVSATESLTTEKAIVKRITGGSVSVGGGAIFESEESNSGSAKAFKFRPKQRYTGALGCYLVLQNLKSGKTYDTATEADFDDIVKFFNDGMIQGKGFRGEVQSVRTTVNDVSLNQLGTHHFVCFTALTGPRTYTLIAPNLWGAVSGHIRSVTVKDESGQAGTHNITIAAPAGVTIEGQASVVINANYGRVTLYSDGVNIFIR